ncbi:hypothetical protein ACQ858_22030 [Variovorax ureilyticus]|uniref:hypothetical protein n=1 Tax=Variovorax ureilyticus TaxID=1836198 RepID=UPI003D6769CE
MAVSVAMSHLEDEADLLHNPYDCQKVQVQIRVPRMKNMTSCAKAVLFAAGALLSVSVGAQTAPSDDRAMGIYVEAGTTPRAAGRPIR